MNKQNQNGVSLISVLIIGIILGVLTLALIRMLSQSFKGQKHVELKDELIELRRFIANSIDCQATFTAAGINPAAPGGSCNSTSAVGGQVAPFLTLHRSTISGSVSLGPLVGGEYMRIGNWAVRATCSEAEKTLIIRAARPKPGGGFFEDPLTKREANWDSPRALISGVGPKVLPSCFQRKRAGFVSVARNTNVTLTCHGYTKIGFPNVVSDEENLFDTSTNNLTLAAGVWLITASFSVNYTAQTNSEIYVALYKNGSLLRHSGAYRASASNGYAGGGGISSLVESDGDDEFSIHVLYDNCPSNLTISGIEPFKVWMQAVRISK